ncbi:Protein kinase dsk1 [Pelomyxa schiedti]|nr:Protein kinase dsk1 [Pelomyxa schiedti]
MTAAAADGRDAAAVYANAMQRSGGNHFTTTYAEQYRPVAVTQSIQQQQQQHQIQQQQMYQYHDEYCCRTGGSSNTTAAAMPHISSASHGGGGGSSHRNYHSTHSSARSSRSPHSHSPPARLSRSSHSHSYSGGSESRSGSSDSRSPRRNGASDIINRNNGNGSATALSPEQVELHKIQQLRAQLQRQQQLLLIQQQPLQTSHSVIQSNSARGAPSIIDSPMSKPLIPKKEDEDEGFADYKIGGYHPVRIGDVYHHKYKILSKFGWGHFSTVWQAMDMTTGDLVALKIVKSAQHYTEAAVDEIQILEVITSNDPGSTKCCAHLLDHFRITGPHGTHVCMAFEVLGSNLLDLIKAYRYRGIPTPIVKYITAQILIGLDYMHTTCKLIHTDLKPENCLLFNKIQPSTHYFPRQRSQMSSTVGFELNNFNVKIIDFGNANWVHKHFTNDIQTRQYRAPEVIIGCPWDTSVDMWSMACMVFELCTGDLLFEPQLGDTFSKEDDHLAQMIELLGDIPHSMMVSGSCWHRYFRHSSACTGNCSGRLLRIPRDQLRFWPLDKVLKEKYRFDPAEADLLADFLMSMLSFDPALRKSAHDCLNHAWLLGTPVPYFLSPRSSKF